MRIIIENDYEEMSKQAAHIIASQLYLKPNSVLGLATGSTPLLTYRFLAKYHHLDNLDFSGVTSFNLDEYAGIGADDPQSYHYYMLTNFFNSINIAPKHIHIPDGMAPDLDAECNAYDQAIHQLGPIDLQILGIGNNGHIGFNEPDPSFGATTHVVRLDDATIQANSRFFSNIEKVPHYAITMGIKTIMNSRLVLLLADGLNKAEIIAKALYGDITPSVPASVLQFHPNLIVILDREAARQLSVLDKLNHINPANRVQMNKYYDKRLKDFNL
jgi:glucosamine-6-phosphate deaminase